MRTIDARSGPVPPVPALDARHISRISSPRHFRAGTVDGGTRRNHLLHPETSAELHQVPHDDVRKRRDDAAASDTGEVQS